jgi:hypothetical protein
MTRTIIIATAKEIRFKYMTMVTPVLLCNT